MSGMCYDVPVKRKTAREARAWTNEEAIQMSTSWILGFIVGMLIVVAVSTVAQRLAKKKGCVGKGQYDERQQVARGKAFTWAYTTLLVYLTLWTVFRTMEVPFFSEALSVWIGALISLGVFVGYAIFHDAYFKASESPKSWIAIISIIGLVNTGLGIARLFRGETIVERLYENMNLFVGLLFVVVLLCIVVKRATDRRAEEE